MKPLNTILVGTLFGPRSDAAVRTATALAKAFQSKIVLLHAIPEQVYSVIAEHPGVAELERRLRQRHLQDGIEGVVEAEVVIERGSAAAAITETAALKHADLVVLGTGGLSETGASHIGITTARVIRKSTLPVWAVVPRTASMPRHILCPVDTSEASRRALRNAHLLSRKFGSKLTVLHVLEPLSTMYAGIDMPDDSIEIGFLSPQKRQFDEFLAGLDFRDEAWIVSIRRGRPHEQILAEVGESDIDLLVMGTVGRAGVARFLLGSVTARVTRKLPCSVLTVKARNMANLRLDADLESIDECLRRGKELLEQGLAAKGVREFDRCLAVCPTLAAAWYGKAQAYERLGDSASAEQARENAERIESWVRRIDSS